jgi:cohesin loading factor subunit SCC2
LARGLERVNLWISSPEDDDNLTLREQSKLQPFGHKVKTALHGVWKDPVRDVFDIG